MSVPFDYLGYLQKLKVGDTIKYVTGKYDVIGVTDKEILIAKNDNIVHFSRLNGREIGSKAGSYKTYSIVPYTQEDRAMEAAAEAKRALMEDKEKLSSDIVDVCLGAKNYCSQRHALARRYSKTSLQKLLRFVKALPKEPNKDE